MLLFEYGEPFYGLSWRQSRGNSLLIYWACSTLHDVIHKCTHWIASFPGPTQLSVACSTVKRGKPGIFSYVRVWRNQKRTKITGSVLHIFNRLHAQCSVCATVAPRLLDTCTCGKLPGTLALCAVLEPVRSCTIKNPFYHPFYPDITHMRKNTSPAFLFWIETTESWVEPGNKATCCIQLELRSWDESWLICCRLALRESCGGRRCWRGSEPHSCSW